MPPGGDFPLADEAAVVRCVRLLTEEEWGPSDAKRLVLALAAVPEGTAAEDPAWQHAAQLVEAVARRAGGEASREFRERWLAHVEARRAGRAQTIAELEALLAAAEALPVYHVGLAGYLWRRAAPVPATATARAQLLGRLELHLRAATALVKGQFEVGPIEFTAWRSKAAPPPGWSGVRVPPGILAAAQRHFASGDAGTWATEATLELAVVGEGVTLLRAGQAVPLAPGGALTLRRLDVLQAARPATLRHAELGDMSLGAGAVVTAWDVGERLPEAGRARVRALVTAAGKGEAQALKQLESILPAAHAEIRRAVAERPGAPGSAGLRTLLTLFDE